MRPSGQVVKLMFDSGETTGNNSVSASTEHVPFDGWISQVKYTGHGDTTGTTDGLGCLIPVLHTGSRYVSDETSMDPGIMSYLDEIPDERTIYDVGGGKIFQRPVFAYPTDFKTEVVYKTWRRVKAGDILEFLHGAMAIDGDTWVGYGGQLEVDIAIGCYRHGSTNWKSSYPLTAYRYGSAAFRSMWQAPCDCLLKNIEVQGQLAVDGDIECVLSKSMDPVSGTTGLAEQEYLPKDTVILNAQVAAGEVCRNYKGAMHFRKGELLRWETNAKGLFIWAADFVPYHGATIQMHQDITATNTRSIYEIPFTMGVRKLELNGMLHNDSGGSVKGKIEVVGPFRALDESTAAADIDSSVGFGAMTGLDFAGTSWGTGTNNMFRVPYNLPNNTAERYTDVTPGFGRIVKEGELYSTYADDALTGDVEFDIIFDGVIVNKGKPYRTRVATAGEHIIDLTAQV